MGQTYRNKNVFLNIPADGLEYGVIKSYDAPLEEYKENIRKYLKIYLDNTAIGTVLFNVFYRRSVVDSDCVDSLYYNIRRDENLSIVTDNGGKPIKDICPDTDNKFLKGYRHLIKRKIDIFKFAVEEARKYGVDVLFSIRMNDHHDINDPGLNSSFSINNFETTSIKGDGESLDYCKKSVRDYHAAYIVELCKNYDVDGVELDFLRTCPVMSCVNEETTNLLTDFIATTKNEAESVCGKNLRFTARIYPDEKTNLEYGIDAAGWISEGIVDTIVPEAWYIPTYYGINANEWKKSIDKRNTKGFPYSVIPGTDWAVRCDSTSYSGYIMWITLEQFKGFASSMYQKGADGIYIFNHFMPDSDLGAHTYYIDKNGVKSCKNVIKDKMTCLSSQQTSEDGLRVYVNTCPGYYNSLYPVPVTQNTPFKFSINTGTKPKRGYFKLVVGIDKVPEYRADTLTVSVNGTSFIQIEDVMGEKGFEWEVNKFFEPPASHVSQVAPRVMQFITEDMSHINAGENVITIKNAGSEQKIKWLEVHVEETEN